MMKVWPKSEFKIYKLVGFFKIKLGIVLDNNKLENKTKKILNLLNLFIIHNKNQVAVILICFDKYFINNLLFIH